VIRFRTLWFSIVLVSVPAILFPTTAEGQTAADPGPTAAQTSGTGTAKDNVQPTQQPTQPTTQQSTQPTPAEQKQGLPESPEEQRERSKRELKEQEQQRSFGVIPNFNTSNNQNAAPLSSRQKFHLAYRSATDPFQFVAAGLDAGYGQATNSFAGYGQGAQGYGKRFGAAYADQVSSLFWGNAVLPSLLHEDPRYFRKGTGGFKKRFVYAMSSAVWARKDNGTWGFNYSNVLGNVAAGGLSNLYYPSTDRGIELTFQRAFTVTAEGMIGAEWLEFGPDVLKKVFHKKPKNETPAPRPVPK